MNILIISQYFYPEQFRVNDIALALKEKGNHVFVLTGLPNYPQGEIYEGYENKGNTLENYNGIVIFRCNLRPRHKGPINLFKNYVSFIKESKKALKKINESFDIIYVYGISPITQLYPAIEYKRKHHVPIIYYCCDLWPESMRGEHYGHKQLGFHNPLYLSSKIVSRHLIRKVDLVLNKCDEFVEYNKTVCGVPYEKQQVLYEHAEKTYLSVSETPVNNNVIDFVFLGNMGRVQNCDLIIKACSKLNRTNDFLIHFVGDGSEIHNLKALTEELKLGDLVKFHGKVPVSEVNKFYELSDVVLLTLSHRTATGLTLPSKLASYLASGRPIIASADGASQKIIKNADCGFVCDADDIQEFIILMQKVVDNPNILHGLGKNGRDYFLKYFTLEKHIDDLEKIMVNMVNI